MSVTSIPPQKEPARVSVPSAPENETDLLFPQYSSWFSLEGVHDIERRAFPDLLLPCGSRDSASTSTYMEYRNFMVSSYRSRPHDYLTLTICRRHLAGDVGTLARLHAFLEQWGLINYMPSITLGNRRPLGQTTSPVQAHHPNASVNVIKDPRAALGAIDHHSLAELAGGLQRIECSGCGEVLPAGAPLYVLMDRERSVPDTFRVRCVQCYANGDLAPGYAPADYLQVQPAALAPRANWTDEQTLKLLECVDQQMAQQGSPDGRIDWEVVASTMARPKEECLWVFLKLPFPGDIVEPASPAESAARDLLASMPAASVPFAFARSPTMALLAFLAAHVHPKLAADVAQSALKCLAEHQHACGFSDGTAGSGGGAMGSGGGAMGSGGAAAGGSASDAASTAGSSGHTASTDGPASPSGSADGPASPSGSADGPASPSGSADGPASPSGSADSSGPASPNAAARPGQSDAWIAAMALALAATRARQLADDEARRLVQLHDTLIALQLRKVQQKMAQLEALMRGIEDERRSVDVQRMAVFYERCKLMARLKEGSGG